MNIVVDAIVVIDVNVRCELRVVNLEGGGAGRRQEGRRQNGCS